MGNTLLRIKQYIDYKGISIHKFEKEVGFSNGSFASQFKKNKTIGVDKLENILTVYPDISPDWLFTGEGDMLKKRSEKQKKEREERIIFLEKENQELLQEKRRQQELIQHLMENNTILQKIIDTYITSNFKKPIKNK